MLATALLLIASVVAASMAAQPAQADPTVTTIPWPNVYMPGYEYIHGDGSITVAPATGSCNNNYSSTSLAEVTLDASGNTLDSMGAGTAWEPCMGAPSLQYAQVAIGSDQTTYMVQRQITAPNVERVIAIRSGATLWSYTVPRGGCSNQPGGYVENIALGFDGNIYLKVMAPCTNTLSLQSIHSATGSLRFQAPLSGSADSTLAYTNDLMPYDDGIAVANGGNNIYYYSYSGSLDSGLTFSPSTPAGSTPRYASITSDGRTFLMTGYYPSGGSTQYNLYYKDLDSSTIHEIVQPTGRKFFYPEALPSGGVAVLLTNSTANTHYYLGYFDQHGTELYETDLTNVAGYTPGIRPSLAVDNLGNAIVVRTLQKSTGTSDQEVYVDSFDSSGTMTRLFDSEATFGTPSKDMFTTLSPTGPITQNIGDGEIYLTLCHQTSGSATSCTSAGNPQIVVIPAPGSFDYPRSAMFSAIDSLTQYIALGDSYASGEGNPPFIEGTDNNGGDGCDRSASNAYPILMPPDTGFSLRAFVACSGATSSDVIDGMNGEPSQLSSLSASTDIVTITVGGDDAEFSDFAAECVLGTCDSGSAQYQTTMEIIDDPLLLQANLETLFSDVAAAAPNAAIKVVGYPEVVAPGGSCPTYLSSGEQIAVETVVTGLNNKLQSAVSNSGSDFQFIDPTMTGSPFEGHDLCSTNPYFFGLNIAEHRFSFHPNADGQAAYEELIANLI